MDAREEALGLLSKLWVKLQGLPNATPVELAAFFILLTFICKFPLSIITHFWLLLKSELLMMLGFLFFFNLPSHSVGPAHDCADLRELLLLLLSQGEDEGGEHLS